MACYWTRARLRQSRSEPDNSSPNARMLTDGSQLVARRLSSATTSKSWASIWIPRFRWTYKSRPLQRHATSTFVPSATSVHYWPSASLKRMGWWQLGWITATRCCWGHQKTTLRDCSASRTRTVSLELSPCSVEDALQTPAQGVALASSATTCDLQDQSSGVQDLAEQEISVPALLTDSLRTSSMPETEGTLLVDQETFQYGSSLACVQAFRIWNLEWTDFEYSLCSFTRYF